MAKWLKFAILFIISIIACAQVFAYEGDGITAFEIFIDKDCDINGKLQECYCLHWKSGTDKKKIIVNIDGTHKEVTQNPLWYRQTIGGCSSSGEPLIRDIPSKIKSIFGKFAYQSSIFTVKTKSKFIGCSEWYKFLYEASDESTDILYALNLDPNLVTYKIMPCVNIADCKRIIFYKRISLIDIEELTKKYEDAKSQIGSISSEVHDLQAKKTQLETDKKGIEDDKKKIETEAAKLVKTRDEMKSEIALLEDQHSFLSPKIQKALKNIFRQKDLIDKIDESAKDINRKSLIALFIIAGVIMIAISLWYMLVVVRRNKERSEDFRAHVENRNIDHRSKGIDYEYLKQITAKVSREDRAVFQNAAYELQRIKGDINSLSYALKDMLNKINESEIENKITDRVELSLQAISKVMNKRDEELFRRQDNLSQKQESMDSTIIKRENRLDTQIIQIGNNITAVDNKVNNMRTEIKTSFGGIFWEKIENISSQSTKSAVTQFTKLLEQQFQKVQQLGSILDDQKNELLQKIDNIREGIKEEHKKNINEGLKRAANEALKSNELIRQIESLSLYDLAKRSNRSISEIDSLAGSPEIVLAANADIWKKGLESAYSALNDLDDPKSHFCFFVLELCHFPSVLAMIFTRKYMADIASAAMNKDKGAFLDKLNDYSQRISIMILPAIMYVLDNMLCPIIHENQRHPIFTIRKFVMQINENLRLSAEEVGINFHIIPVQADLFRCRHYMERSPRVSILIHQLIRSETEYLEVFKEWIEGSVFTDEAKEKDLVIDVVSLGYNIAGEKEPAEKTIVTTYHDIKGKF